MIAGAFSAAIIAVVATVAQSPNPTAMDTVAKLSVAAEAAPRNPSAWYELGQAYNDIKQSALASFTNASDAPWRALISADALLENGHLRDAFTLYRGVADALPSMFTIHESIARIYEQTGHAQWAAVERGGIKSAADACATRRAMCEFRGGRYRTSLDAAIKGADAESRYWTARAANELALAAFKHLESLPDSPERRIIRAARAQAQERYTDAVSELKAAVHLAPQRPELQYQLASAYYSARDYDGTLTALSPLLEAYPDDPRLLALKAQALSQLQRADEAMPILKQLLQRNPNDAWTKLALGRAYSQIGNHKDAIPLLEEQLQTDTDGSLHMQLARAYVAIGQPDKAQPLLARSEELRKADEERRAESARRVISAPK